MYTLVQSFNSTLHHFLQAIPEALSYLAILWGIQLINWLLGYPLHFLGIIPRRLYGLLGIFCSPFLHANFEHLFLNSIPFLALSAILLTHGNLYFLQLSLFIILVSGMLVWLLGRNAIHLGASGLVMGYWSFILMNAYFEGTQVAWLLAGLCLYYFAGLFFNLFPTDKKTSWEGHLLGALAGVLATYYFSLPS